MATSFNMIQRYLGGAEKHREMLVYGLSALILSTLYATAGHSLAPDFVPGIGEFTGTATALACVLLTRLQNKWCWPLGIVSVVAMGAVFWQTGLIGQAWLHTLYYLPIQFWGWWNWANGGANRTELSVSVLSWAERTVWVVAILLFTLIFGRVLVAGWDQAIHTYWDASIVAASVIAQFLLSRKKVEAWLLWLLPVNVSAILLYATTELYMFAALYTIFLVNAGYALWQWWREHAVRERVHVEA